MTWTNFGNFSQSFAENANCIVYFSEGKWHYQIDLPDRESLNGAGFENVDEAKDVVEKFLNNNI